MSKKLKGWKHQPLTLAVALLGLCQVGQAQHAPGAAPSATSAGDPVTVFQNVRLFDGRSSALSGPRNVLVRGNKIERIATGPIPTDRSATTVLIDGGGRTLMPGLIDMHWHAMLVRPTPAALLTGDIGHLNLVAGAEATATLMRGFTTVRDMAGRSSGSNAPSTRARSPARASSRPAPSSPSQAVTATSASRSNCRASSGHRSLAGSRPEPA